MKLVRIIGGAALTGVLVGCASTTPADTNAGGTVTQEVSPAATTEEEQPPGFYIDGEFVEIKKHKGPATNPPEGIINLCDAVPDELLLQLGIDPTDPSRTDEEDFAICTYFTVEDNLSTAGFITSWNREVDYAERSVVIDADPVTSVPNAFTHWLPGIPDERECFVSIETARGTITHNYRDESAGPTTQEEICAVAVRNLETIYSEFRGESK